MRIIYPLVINNNNLLHITISHKLILEVSLTSANGQTKDTENWVRVDWRRSLSRSSRSFTKGCLATRNEEASYKSNSDGALVFDQNDETNNPGNFWSEADSQCRAIVSISIASLGRVRVISKFVVIFGGWRTSGVFVLRVVSWRWRSSSLVVRIARGSNRRFRLRLSNKIWACEQTREKMQYRMVLTMINVLVMWSSRREGGEGLWKNLCCDGVFVHARSSERGM